jgi:error-prone DNA polymerase
VRDLWLRAGLTRSVLERLADADAFRSLGLTRREALWQVRGLSDAAGTERLPLFEDRNDVSTPEPPEPDVLLPDMAIGEEVIQDYRSLKLSLKAHPVGLLRGRLDDGGIVPSGRLAALPSGRRLSVAGLVLVRQRPGSAKGVIFATLEDETGVANVIVWPKVFEKYRSVIIGARFLLVNGRLQSQEGVIHIVADHLEDLTPLLACLSDDAAADSHRAEASGMDGALARADEVRRPVEDDIRMRIKPRSRLARLLRDAPELAGDIEKLARQRSRVLPKGRNFH